jgi:lycopene cyclase domain-containing protein
MSSASSKARVSYEKYTYLLVLLFAIIVPAIFAADRRLRLYAKWRNLLLTILLASIPFVLWDILATARGHWWFNAQYLIGFDIGNLPLEEYLFYVVIGFLAVYTYEVVCYFRGERR